MAEHWIVVGAGSAGCVVANRLSADPHRTVALLEEGHDLAPGAVPAAISGPNFFEAMAEPGRIHDHLLATRTTGGERTRYTRGRGIGGSSAVNAMVALQGSESLYRSWGWTDTDAAFRRVMLPTEPPRDTELGAVDRALLAADDGAQVALLTRRDGRRVTSAEAYLWPVLDRSNLVVRPDSAVDIVRFEGRRATGVRLVDGTELAADRVVLAAGAIHTPTILLRSGVDTRGVGTGLQDHPSVALTLALQPRAAHHPTALVLGSLLQRCIGDNVVQLLPMNHLGAAPEAAGLGLLMVALMTPKGRAGTIGLDAEGGPIVDFAMLEDDRDVEGLLAGVHLALEVLARSSFTEIVEAVYIDDRGTPATTLTDDAAIARWVRANCADYVHASSTCAMGEVVDRHGRLKGYQDVLVCDASVFPSIPDVNTHLPTTMLAERLSADWLGT